jgi:hypothetical protein
MQTAAFYKPSGKVPVMGIFHSLVWGILVGAVVSYLYVPAAIYIPFIYLNIIIWGVYAGIAGIGVMASLKSCKVRNPTVATLLGGIVGLSTLYIQWAIYCSFMLNSNHTSAYIPIGNHEHGFTFDKFIYFLSHPSDMLEFMSKISENGTWAIGRFTSSQNVSGIFLWIIWVIEAAGIVLFPLFISRMIASGLFSECQNRWMDKEDTNKILLEAFSGSNDDFKAKLVRNDFSSLLELKPTTSSSWVHTKVELSSSGSPNENYLSVSFMKPAPTKKKPDGMDSEAIVQHLIVSDVDYKKLKEGLQLQ